MAATSLWSSSTFIKKKKKKIYFAATLGLIESLFPWQYMQLKVSFANQSKQGVLFYIPIIFAWCYLNTCTRFCWHHQLSLFMINMNLAK